MTAAAPNSLAAARAAGGPWAGRSALEGLVAPAVLPSTSAAPPLGIYVHYPYCARKCPYCDFNSHVRISAPEADWLAACLARLSAEAATTPGRRVGSMFFGGGTPSLMAPASAAAIIDHIAGLWSLAPNCEITLEANPSSVEAARFADLAAAGVNRLSVGVQALDDAALAFLGRLHGADEARRAVALAQAAFPRVSLDLIYARPGQTLDAWAAELAEALAFGTGHLSLYQLTIEPQTPFFAAVARGDFAVPGETPSAELYELTNALTAAAGRPLYEISNYAAPGEACRHNLTYWRGQEWLGIGPGAHGRRWAGQGALAQAAHRAPSRWVGDVLGGGEGWAGVEQLDARSRAEEALLMGLRLVEGIDIAALARATGHALRESVLAALESDGLLHRAGPRIAATPRGRLLLNSLVAELAHTLAEPIPA